MRCGLILGVCLFCASVRADNPRPDCASNLRDRSIALPSSCASLVLEPAWQRRFPPVGSLLRLSNDARRLLLLLTARAGRSTPYAYAFDRLWPGEVGARPALKRARVRFNVFALNDFFEGGDRSQGDVRLNRQGCAWHSPSVPEAEPSGTDDGYIFARGSVRTTELATYWRGQPILNPLEVRGWQKQRLLHVLALNPDRLIDNDTLFSLVGWTTGQRTPTERAALVQSLVSSLRRDIYGVDPKVTPLRTVRGRGYSWHDDRATDGWRTAEIFFNAVTGETIYRGQPIALTALRARLLDALLWASPKYITIPNLIAVAKQKSIDAKPNDWDVDALRGHIIAIKKVFLAINLEFASIQNRRGLGYAWVDRAQRSIGE